MDDADHSVGPAMQAMEMNDRACAAELRDNKYDGTKKFDSILADAWLVACYSPHPLVHALQFRHGADRVLGIMEASIQAAANLCCAVGDFTDSEPRALQTNKFGIITTGAAWKPVFDKVIRENFGGDIAARYAGTETIGIDAGDLHAGDEKGASVEDRVKAATELFLTREDFNYPEEVQVIILGCAGMTGMRQWVLQEAESLGASIQVVDGVKVGVGMLQAYLRAGA